jgi:hypothetical protein
MNAAFLVTCRQASRKYRSFTIRFPIHFLYEWTKSISCECFSAGPGYLPFLGSFLICHAMCEFPKRKIACEMNRDPLETSGQDRRSAGRIKAIYSLLSCPASRGILPPCFMAIPVILPPLRFFEFGLAATLPNRSSSSSFPFGKAFVVRNAKLRFVFHTPSDEASAGTPCVSQSPNSQNLSGLSIFIFPFLKNSHIALNKGCYVCGPAKIK